MSKPLNRDERRAREHGSAEPLQDNLRPQSENNPGGPLRTDVSSGGGPDESVAGRPDQDQVHITGAGTGGATESEGRLLHHEGMHLPNRPNA